MYCLALLGLNVFSLVNEGNPKVTSFNLAEEAQAEGAK